jgi:hypothetical protein
VQVCLLTDVTLVDIVGLLFRVMGGVREVREAFVPHSHLVHIGEKSTHKY